MEQPPPVDDPQPVATATPAGRRPAMDRGDVVNRLAALRRHLEASEALPKLTDVQNRLVMRRLEEAGTWEKPRARLEEQIQRIAKTIAGVTGIGVETIEQALRDGA